MKILFAGNPEIAVPTLKALLVSKHSVVGVLTNPDVFRGGSQTSRSSPVKSVALSNNIMVYDPLRLTPKVEEDIKSLGCDLLVCFAYGKIFKESFLSLFPMGGVNIHPSLLPKYRGPTPIQAALLSGEEKTGITIQRMVLKMDAGNIVLQKEFSLKSFLHASSVVDYVAHQSSLMIESALDLLEDSSFQDTKQDESLASYCYLLDANSGRIYLDQDHGDQVLKKIRAYTYTPGAYLLYNDKKLIICQATFEYSQVNHPIGKVISFDRCKGLQIQVKEGFLWVLELQLQGKKRMNVINFYNGNRNIVGIILR